jgi:hypothetical protein
MGRVGLLLQRIEDAGRARQPAPPLTRPSTQDLITGSRDHAEDKAMRLFVRGAQGELLHVAFELDAVAAARFQGTATRLAARRVA